MVKAVKKTLSIQQETKKLFTWLTVTNKGSDAINAAALEINGVTKAMSERPFDCLVERGGKKADISLWIRYETPRRAHMQGWPGPADAQARPT